MIIRADRKAVSNPTVIPDASHAIFLRPSEFMTLAISRQKLLRADEPRLGVRGLADPKTGNLYFVEVSRLQLP